MSHSLAHLAMHLVFSTKHRERRILDVVRRGLHAYMFNLLQQGGCHVHAINSVEDHIHILFDLPRTRTVSTVVGSLKAASSRWMQLQGANFKNFSWQGGYGIFAVSKSGLKRVERYIAKQREHHRAKTFQQEYRAILQKHELTYDERYIWE